MVPKISVIMPVYNSERYVAQAVESVLAQTFGDFEFLIVDDGSTDGSLEILKAYADRDPRVRLRSRPNTGYVFALNEMLADARGEYIARMDADDVSLLDRFEKQIEYLEDNSDCVCVGAQVLLIDPSGRPMVAMSSPLDHCQIDRELLSGKCVLCHPTAIYRRQTVEIVGAYRNEFYTAEDVDLWLRFAEIGKLANLPDILLKYRMHFESIGNSRRAQQVDATNRAIQQAYLRRSLPLGLPHESEFRAMSRSELLGKWGWWALQGGNVSVARYYAARCILASPTRLNSWKLAACALRGY